MLKDGKKSAGEIAREFDITQATISYHLSQLKKAGLILESKYKNYVFYEINVTVFEEVMLWFSQFKGKNMKKNSKEMLYLPFYVASHCVWDSGLQQTSPGNPHKMVCWTEQQDSICQKQSLYLRFPWEWQS